MNTPFPSARSSGCARGFTLIEILVSMSVLLLLGILLAQILNSTTRTATGTEKQIESNAEARLVFDRLGRDIGGIAKNGNIHFLFRSKPGNDDFYFFSETTGYFAGDVAAASATSNSYSLVGYRVSDLISAGERHELERLARGLHWAEPASGISDNGPCTSLFYLPLTIQEQFNKALDDRYNNSSNLRPAGPANTVPQWDVIGEQVFRMEFCYMLKGGAISDLPILLPTGVLHKLNGTTGPTSTDDSAKGYAPGSRWFDESKRVFYLCKEALPGNAVWQPLGWADVQSLIVAVATVDSRSRLASTPDTFEKLAEALADFDPSKIDSATHQPFLMASTWSQKIKEPAFISSPGMAATAASVRIYQQHFDLN